MIDLMVLYSLTFLGVPYRWGGENPMEGYDCSGFLQEILSSVGLDPPGDQTAQTLYNSLSKKDWRSGLGKGSILFFGSSREHISHVALCVDVEGETMIEAGGGNSSITSVFYASKHNAFIRLRPISNRTDLVAVLKPGKE